MRERERERERERDTRTIGDIDGYLSSIGERETPATIFRPCVLTALVRRERLEPPSLPLDLPVDRDSTPLPSSVRRIQAAVPAVAVAVLAVVYTRVHGAQRVLCTVCTPRVLCTACNVHRVYRTAGCCTRVYYAPRVPYTRVLKAAIPPAAGVAAGMREATITLTLTPTLTPTLNLTLTLTHT